MEDLQLHQLAQQLKWMEEERRKDRAQIATLQERIAGQTHEIEDLSRRIKDMDGLLKSAQTAVARLQQPDKIMEEFKTDLVGLINRQDDEYKKGQRENDRLRILAVESLQRQITEVKQEIPRIGKIEDELPNRRAEEKRLGEQLQRLQPQIDVAMQLVEERTRGVPYLEEGRRQDVKRLLAVEQEIIGHLKKIDALGGRQQILEEAVSRVSPRFEPIAIRLAEHDKQLDDLRSGDFRLQQQVKAYETSQAQLRDQVVDYTAVLTRLREQALINQRAETELNNFQETLRMRVAELSEVERLFEERVKRQFEEFLSEFEKRWGRLEPRLEEHWHEHERTHGELDGRLEEIEAFPEPLQAKLQILRDEHEQMVQAFVNAATSLIDNNKSSLPNYPVPPAQMPEDGMGLPTTSIDRR